MVFPSGIATSGWLPAKAQLAEMGIVFDGWQEAVSTLALGKRADGMYAATIGGVVLSIPRQVGKTFLVAALIFALCILFPGLTVVWTAHRTRTATRTFQTLQGLARRKKVAPHIDHVRVANGEQEIGFDNGSIIMFGAREQGFGRGFDAVDVEVFDEAQILTERALEDMVAATNQARHPAGALLFFLGTPPRPVDPGEAFALKRARALSGKADDMVYVEFSADPDTDPDDRKQWSVMNPSYPGRTPLTSMLRLRENLPSDDAWNREARGIWDVTQSKGVIPGPSWADAEDERSIAADRLSLGVEVGPDLAWASIGLAGQRSDGDWHIELDDDQHTRGRGVAWLVPALEQLVAANPRVRAVVVDVAGPIAALLERRGNNRWYFKGTRLAVRSVKVAELGAGCAAILAGVVSGTVHHIGQPQLSTAALAAGKRPLGDTGMWVWSRKTAQSDITPIQACTLALIGTLDSKPRRPGGGQRTSTTSRRAVVLNG